MASSKLWAEAGVAVDPGAALRSSGYVANDIPAAQHFNWLFQMYGRSAIRQYDTAEELIASEDEIGIVLPAGGLGSYITPAWQLDWLHAGDANESEICSDGQYLWTVAGAGANRFIRRRKRADGSVDLDQPGAPLFDYPFVACLGGNVYVLDDAAGVPQIRAFDRVTLTLLYSVALPGAATARGIATDGFYVAVIADNVVHLYQDTGAALVATGGTYNHTAQINDLVMDGARCIIGGATPGTADQLRVLTYGAGGFTLYATLDRAGNPQALRVAIGDEAIACSGDIDTADYTALWRSEVTTALRWAGTFATNDVALVDGMLVEAGNGSIRFLDLVDGLGLKTILWDAGAATAVNRLAYDNDALFVLGAATAGGHRLKRYSIHTQPRIFRTLNPATTLSRRYTSGVPSLLQPVR
jgi:hypothetical protein